MLTQYISLALFALVAFALGAGVLAFASAVGPRVRSRQKFEPYECGLEQVDTPHKPVAIKFYTFALLFILFDVETIFLLPWAFGFKGLIGSGALPLVLVFLGLLALGLYYVIKTGALEWQ
ncbi:MAG: NADH-quinone oxidoreductase subunit A [Myxococcales bacterium]|nr:NADH-quinone oxidoreductase subunit A [Myxococcales bacterium]